MTGESPAPDEETVALAHKLLDAARAGDTAVLGSYLAAGVPATLTNAAGDSLLMLAAYHGHCDTVAALISHGADVDLPNDRNQSPISGAIFKGEEQVVRALVAAGADLDFGSPSARETAAMFGRAGLLDPPADDPDSEQA